MSNLRLSCVSTIFALSIVAAPAHALGITALDAMQQFTNITLGNLTARAETEGTVFVGGNYSGGANVNPDKIAQVDLGGGLVGSLFVGGNIAAGARPHVSSGNAFVGGTLLRGASVNMNGGGKLTTGASIPVAEMVAAMTGLSDQLSLLADTGGTANLSDRNKLSFVSVADADQFAVFNVTDSWLKSGTLMGISAKSGVTTIINVSGTNINIGVNANQTLTNVVFNFFEAQNIKLNSAFNYSILAPYAYLDLGGGGVNGTVVSGSLNQKAEIRPANFTGNLPSAAAVPLPAAAPMLLAGLAVFGLIARRRRAA